MTVLEAREISKSFPDGKGTRQVLSTIDLSVESSQIIGVVGASGSGKSTLLKVVGGLLKPDEGTITIAGEELNYENSRTVSDLRRRHIGWVTQELDLIPTDSISANVALPLLFEKPRPGRAKRESLVKDALHRASFSANVDRKINKLSSGERQRVAIARALVNKPRLLVTDEPTSALDEGNSARIIEALKEIATSGTSVIVATHDPLVMKACDRIYRFNGPHLNEGP